MLDEAKQLQKEAVNNLITAFNNQNKTITFKAPTGSGKTFMMADFMNRILEKDSNAVFVVSSPSKGDLAKQNYEKFIEYSNKRFFIHLNPFLINSCDAGEGTIYLPQDFNIYVLPRDLYKENAKLKKSSYNLERFLENLTRNENFGGQGKTVYLIKDECHIKTNNIDNNLLRYFSKIINISATPKNNQPVDVEITEQNALNACLIKNVNYNLVDENEEDDGYAIIALKKFKEIKEDYRSLLGVNPCLIIQISNKEKGNDELNAILTNLQSLEYHDLHWMYIVDKEKDCKAYDDIAQNTSKKYWKDIAKEKLSTIDVIIFKLALTEGWDIPRACMLYQSRNVRSEQLKKQVIGRVRRNPRLLDYETLSDKAKELAMTSWVWGNVPEESKGYHYVHLQTEGKRDIENKLKIKTTYLNINNVKTDIDLNKIVTNRMTMDDCNIFKLYKELNKCNNDIKSLCYSYVSEDVDKWFNCALKINEIKNKYSSSLCDYDSSMKITKDENGNELYQSLPEQSCFYDGYNRRVEIKDWVWSNKDSKYFFDSEAEYEWAKILKEIQNIENIEIGKINPQYGQIDITGNTAPKYNNSKNIKLWGKNFLQNSKIKYEYYLNGIHSSYPDFILKDNKCKIHLFEVKSSNNANNNNIDRDQYNSKVEELKKCYLQVSKLTDYIFYLPIKQGNNWNITKIENGVILPSLSLEEFKNSFN